MTSEQTKSATDRADAIARIKALRARAADAASSEAEAEAAARIAARIIAEHEVSESELLERGTAGISEGEHNKGRAKLHPTLDICCFAIGRLSECKALSRRGANIWVGQPEDVEFALYLCELIQAASERAYQDHWRQRFRSAPSPKYRRSFHLGFGDGISMRMLRMAEERDRTRQSSTGTGSSLVVVKDALIKSYMESAMPGIKSRKVGKRDLDYFAAVSGQMAANRVTLNRPLGDETEAMRGIA